MARRGENIYERKDGRFEGRYIKGYDINGKAIIGYVYSRSYKEAKEKLTLAKAQIEYERNKPSSEMYLSEWFEQWLSTQKHIKKSSYSVYSSLIKRHIVKKLGKLRLCNLTKDNLQDFVDNLAQKFQPSYVRTIYTVLRLGLDAAEERDLVNDICKKIKLPKLKHKEVIVFSKQEQKDIEKYLENSSKPNDIGVLICLYTGIRIGELCALTWDNIDLVRGIISVNKTLYRAKTSKGRKKTELIITSPKSDSSIREIPLPKFLIDKLSKIENKSGFLINRTGKFVEPTVYARRFKAILKECNIRNVKFHTTRHTFATRALEIGMDIKTLSEILGHASPTITLNTYSHSLPEHKKKEMNRLGKMYNPSK